MLCHFDRILNATDRIAISISCVITLTHDKNENYKKNKQGLIRKRCNT